MFIDSIPKELADKQWTQVSDPHLELDRGKDASYQMLPELWVNTHLPLHYRYAVVVNEGKRFLVVEIEDYEGERTASQFEIASIKKMEAIGGTTNSHGELALWGRVNFEMADGTGHRFSFVNKGCAEDFLQDIKHVMKPPSYKEVLVNG